MEKRTVLVEKVVYPAGTYLLVEQNGQIVDKSYVSGNTEYEATMGACRLKEQHSNCTISINIPSGYK